MHKRQSDCLIEVTAQAQDPFGKNTFDTPCLVCDSWPKPGRGVRHYSYDAQMIKKVARAYSHAENSHTPAFRQFRAVLLRRHHD
jgi:hypothetical protein